MNKLIFLSRIIISIIIIQSLTFSLNAQTVDSGKKVAPATGKKTESIKNDTKSPTLTETKEEKQKLPDTKKSADDKKTVPPKEQSKEQMSEKNKADKISQTLDYGIQKDRKIAINMIKEINDEQLKKTLLQKLASIISNDADMEIRKNAVTALGDHNSTENSQAVINALDDDNDDVRIAACYSIGKMKLVQAKPKLIEIVKKQDLANPSNFTDAVIIALGDLNAPEVIDFAIESLKNIKTNKMIRERLTLFIGKCGSAAQKDFLVTLYKDDEEDMTIRSYAVKSIAKLQIKEAAIDIKAVIKDIDSYSFSKKKKYYDLYMQSVTALVEFGDTDSIPLLMNSIRSDNAEVRYKAVILIKEFNDERTIDILKYKMKNDPSGKVRKAARKALEEKGAIEKESIKDYSTDSDEKNEDTE
jgi:HEAT repeat protein